MSNSPRPIKQAAKLIGKAKLPLYGGLATDVEGMRAVLALAERSGGVVDHALSEAQYRNFKILQTSGWIMSTLTETRNRADLIHHRRQRHPQAAPALLRAHRLAARLDVRRDGAEAHGRVHRQGARPLRRQRFAHRRGDHARLSITSGRATSWRCSGPGCAASRIKPPKLGGVTLAEIDALAERCRNAKYGVVVWAPPSLNFPHADLAVDQFTGLVKDLNQTTRFAGLALGGAEGAVTAAAVCTWISGYPLRVSYASGAPDYDPYRYAIGRMLKAGEGDLLVWIASISPTLVAAADQASDRRARHPGPEALTETPEVFIPVGTPGLDHAGRLVRVDNVVSLPLKDLGRAELPIAADVLAAIEAAL